MGLTGDLRSLRNCVSIRDAWALGGKPPAALPFSLDLALRFWLCRRPKRKNGVWLAKFTPL